VLHDDPLTDWVRDFELGTDTLGLADGITYGQLEITGTTNSFISFEGEQIGVLLDVNSSDLTASDFQVV
ncbi:MAG: hypothetical protein AAFY63_21210, partial [Cyanobacteria bacterium J06643_13]